MSPALEKLIQDLTSTTSLSKAQIIKMYNQEMKETEFEEEAIHNVYTRIEYMML